MRRGLRELSTCLLLAGLSACTSVDEPNEGPALRPPGQLRASEEVPVGDEKCFYGGTMVRVGLDSNRDGQLSAAETSEVELSCAPDPFGAPVGDDGTPAASRIEAKGGPGGQAGPGGAFSAALNHSNAGHYAILSSGSADSSFLFPEPSAAPSDIELEHLGPPTDLDFEVAPGIVLRVPVVASAPTTLAPGELVADLSGALFASDEAQGVRAVQSLRIGSQATLVLEPIASPDPGAEPLLRIRLMGALVNEGRLYVESAPVPFGLDIEVDSYFGSSDAAVLASTGDSGFEGAGPSLRFAVAKRFDNQGLVDTSGVGPGSAAGALTVQAAEIVSSGTLRARGGNAAPGRDAGAGGDVLLAASGSIVTLGSIDAAGGSLGRHGGPGGTVTLRAEGDRVWNSAAIELSGGSGTGTGGDGGELTVLAEGDIRNDADVSANGGHGDIQAGAAGQILLSTRGLEPLGSVQSTGELSAAAGTGSANGQARGGGLVVILADSSIRHEGDIRVDGSTGQTGGSGGLIQLLADSRDVHASGVFSARGGAGVTGGGGAGGQVVIDGHAVAVRGAVDLVGGPSTSSPAGSGGSFRVDAADAIHLSFSEADLSGGGSHSGGGPGGRLELTAGSSIHCEGSIDLSGGSGASGGRGGRAEPKLRNLGVLLNACDMTANGGNGATGPGGQGGALRFTVASELYSDSALSASGGGSIESDAGDGGEVTFVTNGSAESTARFEISGDVEANGGAALADSARGGAGGLVAIPLFNNGTDGFEVRLLGYDRIDLSGGDGSSVGGNGGVLDINNGLFEEDPTEDARFGDRGVISYVDILANGGAGGAGVGGDGGTFVVRTAPLGGSSAATALYNYGNWELRGGAGESVGGQGGAFLVNTADGIFFLGDIVTSGGDSAGEGGDGSERSELSTRGPIFFKGGMQSRGGHSLHGDAPAGIGGHLALVSSEAVELSEGADLSGGDNMARLGEGGSGGTFIVFVPSKDSMLMGRSVDLSGGLGLTEGPAGKFHFNDLSILIPEELAMTEQIN